MCVCVRWVVSVVHRVPCWVTEMEPSQETSSCVKSRLGLFRRRNGSWKRTLQRVVASVWASVGTLRVPGKVTGKGTPPERYLEQHLDWAMPLS